MDGVISDSRSTPCGPQAVSASQISETALIYYLRHHPEIESAEVSVDVRIDNHSILIPKKKHFPASEDDWPEIPISLLASRSG
jgi:hypothetical protein